MIRGAGNDSDGKYEGVHYNNVIATYLHGPLLPKNPQIADFLIDTALKRRGITDRQKSLNDTYAEQARIIAKKRPR